MSRRPLFLATLVALALAPALQGGVVIEVKTRFPDRTGDETIMKRMLIEGERLRIVFQETSRGPDTELLFLGDFLLLVSHEERTITPVDVQAIAAAATPSPRELAPLGEAEFTGRPCSLYRLSRGGEAIAELCMVPFSSLAGGEEAARRFESMAAVYGELLAALEASPALSATARLLERSNPFSLGTGASGFPLMSRQLEAGRVVSESLLERVVIRALSAQELEPPADYLTRPIAFSSSSP